MSRAVGHLIKAIKPAVLNDSMMAALMYLAFNAHSDVRPAWDLITSCQHGGWHRVTAYPPYPPSYLSYPPHASPIIQCQCNTQFDKDQFRLFLDFHHQGLSSGYKPSLSRMVIFHFFWDELFFDFETGTINPSLSPLNLNTRSAQRERRMSQIPSPPAQMASRLSCTW